MTVSLREHSLCARGLWSPVSCGRRPPLGSSCHCGNTCAQERHSPRSAPLSSLLRGAVLPLPAALSRAHAHRPHPGGATGRRRPERTPTCLSVPQKLPGGPILEARRGARSPVHPELGSLPLRSVSPVSPLRSLSARLTANRLPQALPTLSSRREARGRRLFRQRTALEGCSNLRRISTGGICAADIGGAPSCQGLVARGCRGLRVFSPVH